MDMIVGESLILTRLAQRQVLEEALRLPHEVIIPDVMLADTLLDFGGYDGSALVEMGARVGHLDSEGVELATTYQAQYPALSTSETFALVLAEAAGEGAILLSGPPLSGTAESHGLEVRGFPWMVEEMRRHGTVGIAQPRTALW